jgi:hypothetical protein
MISKRSCWAFDQLGKGGLCPCCKGSTVLLTHLPAWTIHTLARRTVKDVSEVVRRSESSRVVKHRTDCRQAARQEGEPQDNSATRTCISWAMECAQDPH